MHRAGDAGQVVDAVAAAVFVLPRPSRAAFLNPFLHNGRQTVQLLVHLIRHAVSLSPHGIRLQPALIHMQVEVSVQDGRAMIWV